MIFAIILLHFQSDSDLSTLPNACEQRIENFSWKSNILIIVIRIRELH